MEPDKEAALGLETVVPEWHRFLCWARENKLLMLKTWGRGCRDEAEPTAQYAGSYLKFAKRGCKEAAAEETNCLLTPWSSQKNKLEAAGRFAFNGEKSIKRY